MIPKVINYCWFGKNPKPEIVYRCIDSWKKNCPEFKIVEWNEDNFDFSDCPYAIDAYKNKKWAFVSDYARVKVLLENGGIYCDTDVEIIKPLDDLLKQEAFIGFELGLDGDYGVNTGSMMGTMPGNEFFQRQVEEYKKYQFGEVMPNGRTKTCVDYSTDLMVRHGLKKNNIKQEILGVTVYPNDYFSPRNMKTGKIELTGNSCSIHRYDGTWATPSEQYGYHLKWECIEKYGIIIGKVIYGTKYSLYIIRHDGMLALFKKVGKKISKK